MKVLMLTRSTLFTSPGGDSIHIELTAKYLRKLGAEVDVKLSNSRIDYSKYDLIHFFNIIRPADLLVHLDKSPKPCVISPIFVKYDEYQKKGTHGLFKLLFNALSNDQAEYCKTLARWFLNGEEIVSKEYLYLGHRKSIEKITAKCQGFLVNSHSELSRFINEYGQLKAKCFIIPNAMDFEIFNENVPKNNEYLNSIACVARIEGRKNQLNLIKALRHTPHKLLIIGKPSPNASRYYQECKKYASKNVTFMGQVSQTELATILGSAKVHAMPSWFETTGLSSLEAGAMGCNIVVSDKGDEKEYFKDYAYYCNPQDPESIRRAVLEAFESPFNSEFRRYIRTNYTWDRAAQITLNAYQSVLEGI